MTSGSLRAVLMNDTRDLGHVGCRRVMRLIESQLAHRGIRVVARSRVRADWPRDRRFLGHLARCDLVVINGEGTLHHGAPTGKRLLDVVDHPARGSTPVVLINALYQENPADWARQLDRMSLVVARDSWSAAELGRAVGRDVGWVGDMSMTDGFVPAGGGAPARSGVVVGDSVFPDVTLRLAEMAREHPGARLLPMQDAVGRRPEDSAPFALAAWQLREWCRRIVPGAVGDKRYLRSLAAARLHVTGRFHAACLSIVTRTPFLAVASNSWKVEALLHDFGIGTHRMVSLEAAGGLLAADGRHDWTAAEADRVEAGVAECVRRAGDLFAAMAALARRGRAGSHPGESSPGR